MYSSTSICNMALGYLGQAPISSLKQDNERARWLQLFYEPVRDEVLRTHNWAFAAIEKPLIRLAHVPVCPGHFYYKYPADALFVRRISAPNQLQYPLPFTEQYDTAQHQRILIVGVAEAWVYYTRRITDETQFDAAFAKTFALALASDAALALTGDVTLATRLQQQYALYLEEARRANMAENLAVLPQTDGFSEVR